MMSNRVHPVEHYEEPTPSVERMEIVRVTFYFTFGQPRLAHRLRSETPGELIAVCGVRRNNNGSVRWTEDPRGRVCPSCGVSPR